MIKNRKTVIENHKTTGSVNKRHGIRLTSWRLAINDLLLLTIAFFITNYIKRGSLHLPEGYGMLLCLFYGSWLVSGLAGKKFTPGKYQGYRGGWVLFRSALYLTYAIVFIVVMFGLHYFSRIHIFATCGALLGLELLVWGFTLWKAGPFQVEEDAETKGQVLSDRFQKEGDGPETGFARFSYRFFALDLGLFFAAFFIVNYLKRETLALEPGYDKLLLMLLTLLLGVSLLTRKFHGISQRNFYFTLWQWIKAGILMMAATAVLVFGLRMFHYSRLQGFGTIFVLLGLEALALIMYYARRKEKKIEPDIESVDQVRRILEQEPYDLNVDIESVRRRLLEPANNKLLRCFQSENMEFYNFLSDHINLKEMLSVEAKVDRNSEFIPIGDDDMMLRLFVSTYKINDRRRINAHFLNIHKMLLPGGYFAGYAHTIQTHYDWIYSRYPRQLAHVAYALDFFIHRVIPKLPWLQKVYFAMTKGRNRIISRAEVLGRLCFCGFEIMTTEVISNRFYFIVRKVKTPSLDANPTYGPLVALKRSGYGGKMVLTYKFRTMHPYSEYLQQYMYDLHGLQKGGKIENDFRMTTWGRIMRKLWLDELPMLYNWLKGDFGLVGVRPLSSQYLSLYDADLQKLRRKVRPGLVPPFYADLPETFEEICESERRYIEAFLERPVRTQIRYFFKAFFNIFLKGARSR